MVNFIAFNIKKLFVAKQKTKSITLKYSDLKDGFYHLYTVIGNTPCDVALVKLYTNPDTNERGVGFGIWDGGGFLPLRDITEYSKLVPLYQLEFDDAIGISIGSKVKTTTGLLLTTEDQTC